MPPRDILLALAFPALMALQAVAAKIGQQHFPPFLMLGLRFAIMAALLLPFARIPAGYHRRLAGLAIVQGVVMMGAFYLGVRSLDTAAATVIYQLNVPFGLLLAFLLLRERVTLLTVCGTVIAFIGVVIVTGGGGGDSVGGAMLITVAAISMACGNILARRLSALPSVTVNAWMSLYAALAALLVSLVGETGQLDSLRTAVPEQYGAILATALGGIGAFGALYLLLARHPVSKVTPVGLVQPIFAAALAWPLLGETVSLPLVVGAALTIMGVLLVQLPGRAAGKRAASAATQSSS